MTALCREWAGLCRKSGLGKRLRAERDTDVMLLLSALFQANEVFGCRKVSPVLGRYGGIRDRLVVSQEHGII